MAQQWHLAFASNGSLAGLLAQVCFAFASLLAFNHLHVFACLAVCLHPSACIRSLASMQFKLDPAAVQHDIQTLLL